MRRNYFEIVERMWVGIEAHPDLPPNALQILGAATHFDSEERRLRRQRSNKLISRAEYRQKKKQLRNDYAKYKETLES